MNYFHYLSVEDDELEQEDKPVLSSVVEDDFTAVKSVDETGKPFETPKHEIMNIRKTNSQIKNKALKLAKQKRMEAWQLAEKQRISDAQSKLIEFENKAKKGISVSLTENYTDIILKLLHIIHKDKPLSEIEIICKTFIEKLNDYWNEYLLDEMEEEEDNQMEQIEEMDAEGVCYCYYMYGMKHCMHDEE